jgi:hypothetical protein
MQSEKELNELKCDYEKNRLELEALNQAKIEPVVRVIDDSDDENDTPPKLQSEHNKLKQEFEAMKDEFRAMKIERNQYYEKWVYTLSEKEQQEEYERSMKTEKQLKKEEIKKKQEVAIRQLKNKGIKSVISIIDDSDEEGDEEEGVITVRLKDNKIMKALESDCEFLD